jgi:hypothetical protein
MTCCRADRAGARAAVHNADMLHQAGLNIHHAPQRDNKLISPEKLTEQTMHTFYEKRHTCLKAKLIRIHP